MLSVTQCTEYWRQVLSLLFSSLLQILVGVFFLISHLFAQNSHNKIRERTGVLFKLCLLWSRLMSSASRNCPAAAIFLVILIPSIS
ncbi:hypothetical protein GE061_019990 [Apolygus lucorum]|uniref:Uncharacterized protein n=1 Tax=Apolygus lucorum TaxID=248454 RepID=A0A6A4JQM8_APOLU|nr:hypothetical protein GE061_019990 [Apolygus lucorum]